MNPIDELLESNEQPFYQTRQHHVTLIVPAVTKVALVVILIAAGVQSNIAFGQHQLVLIGGLTASQVIPLACGVISFLVLASIVNDYMRWRGEHYAITDHRLVLTHGFMGRRVVQLPFEHVQNTSWSQNPLGQLIGYGKIEIVQHNNDVHSVDYVIAPKLFHQKLSEAQRDFEQGYGYLDDESANQPTESYRDPPPDDPRPTQENHHTSNEKSHSFSERLEDLKALRDRGILSLEEFETQLRELRDRA